MVTMVIFFFFSFLQMGHVGPTHILEATANTLDAGSCMRALPASGLVGARFFFLRFKRTRVCFSFSP